MTWISIKFVYFGWLHVQFMKIMVNWNFDFGFWIIGFLAFTDMNETYLGIKKFTIDMGWSFLHNSDLVNL